MHLCFTFENKIVPCVSMSHFTPSLFWNFDFKKIIKIERFRHFERKENHLQEVKPLPFISSE